MYGLIDWRMEITRVPTFKDAGFILGKGGSGFKFTGLDSRRPGLFRPDASRIT